MNELAAALCKAQAQMSFAVKDSKNPHFGNRYADLAAVWDAIRKPLTDNGLSVTQVTGFTVENGATRLHLVTTLWHSSGQSLQSLYPITPVKNDPQGIGSAITYARRYALSALVGVVQDDDDGNAASGRQSEAAPPAPRQARPAAPRPEPEQAAPVASAPSAEAAEPKKPTGAKAWVEQAKVDVLAMKTKEAVDLWEKDCADKLHKLQSVSPSLFDALMKIVWAHYGSLPNKAEAA